MSLNIDYDETWTLGNAVAFKSFIGQRCTANSTRFVQQNTKTMQQWTRAITI